MSTSSPSSAGIRRPVGTKSKRTKAPPPPSSVHHPNGTASTIHTNGNAPTQKGIYGSCETLEKKTTNGFGAHHEENRQIIVVLPDGRSVKATVANSMPMLDLLVLVGAKNRLNPASHMITRIAADANGEPIQVAPNKCVADLDEDDIIKVLPKNTQEHFTLKRKEKKSAKFDQTIRLTVITDKSHRLVVRVNPARPLLELFPVICKERGVDPSHHVLRLTSKPDEPLNMRETLTNYGVTEILLVDTRDPEGPPEMLEKKKKSGFFSRLTRKKKGYELGGGGDSVLPTPTNTTRSSKPVTSLNQSVISTKEPPSQLNISTVSSVSTVSAVSSVSTVSRNVNASKKRRPAPKPPGAKAPAPVMTNPTQDDYAKGIVSHTGSLKKRKAPPPPPKVPDPIAESPESPTRVSSDGQSEFSGDATGLVTSTPMHVVNKRHSRSPSPSRSMDPPSTPPPPPLLEDEDTDEFDDENKTPSKPPRPLSFEGLEDSQEEDGSEFEFPPPPSEMQLKGENDEQLQNDDDESEDDFEHQGAVSGQSGRVVCAYCRNPENGECECRSNLEGHNQAEAEEKEKHEDDDDNEEDDSALVQVSSPAPKKEDQLETATRDQTTQSQEAFVADDQSYYTLHSDSVDFNSDGGGGVVHLEITSGSINRSESETSKQKQSADSDDTLPDDGIPAVNNEPVILVGIKRLASQSTETDFSSGSDSECDTKSENLHSEVPPSAGTINREADLGEGDIRLKTKPSSTIIGAPAQVNNFESMQVSRHKAVVEDEYQVKGKEVFFTTGDSDAVKVEGYSVKCSASGLQDQTKAERQEALSRMMKLSFEVEDSNETTNCSPSPHPEKDVNMLEEKSLHALAYDVKRMPVSIEDDLENEEEEEVGELEEKEDEEEETETKDNQGEVGLSIEALREQYLALQQQIALMQQQLMSQQQQQVQPVPAAAAAVNLNMQHLQQQQLMMQQQMMLQQMQNPQGMAMMMQQPFIYGMVPVAAAPPSMQVPIPGEGVEVSDTQVNSEQIDMAVQHTPDSPKDAQSDASEDENGTTDATSTTLPDDAVEEDTSSKDNAPLKMLSQGSSQSKGKALKYSSYIMSAKREFARKEAQRPRTSSNPPQASVSPNVVEMDQRWRSNTVDGDVSHRELENEKTQVIEETTPQEKYPPEAVVQPMPQVAPEQTEKEAPEQTENVTPEHVESTDTDSDSDHATITTTSITASTTVSSTSATSLTANAEVETATFTTSSEGGISLVEETDTNKQTSIPQARVAPVPAAKPASRGPARRIGLISERDKEVAKIGNVGNVTKFRQMFGGGDH